MRIIGFNLTKISVKKKEKIIGQLTVNQNIDIIDIKPEKIEISENEALKVYFKFIIDYSDDSAKLEFEGIVLTLPEKEELKKFLDSWKDKQLPEDMRVPIFNFIMNKCNVLALNIEDDMALPYHIPMPRLDPNQAKNPESEN